MGDLNCYFHKDRTAASKCDECGRYICLECQYESTESVGSTSVPTKICPYCKADKIENNDNLAVGIIACVGFVFFLIVAFGMFSIGGPSFDPEPDNTGVGLSIFIVILVIVIIVGTIAAAFKSQKGEQKKKTNAEAEAIRAKARKALEDSKNIKSLEEKHIPLYCRFCGAPIEADEKVCSYCGMNWVWKQDTDSP